VGHADLDDVIAGAARAQHQLGGYQGAISAQRAADRRGEQLEAAVDVANALGLPANWLNSGPTSIVETGFPEGFASRVEVRRYGGLTLDVASRYDQIFLKLYAAADQWPGSKHADDLRRLEPTREELIAAAKWTMSQDPSEGFKQLLGNTLRELGLNDADSLL